MRSGPRSLLRSEIEELERILRGLPADALIERSSLEKRLLKKRESLESIPGFKTEHQSLRLTFRGAPVESSHGISADFAGKASNAFADAFSAVLAGMHHNLKYMGPIPDKAKYPLLITGTAVGSFGFEIELPIEDDLFEDHPGSAVEKIKEILRVSATGTDDEVTEAVSDIHPRAVRKISDFLGVLHQGVAWCGLEYKNDYFKFKDIKQLEYSERRLKEENISRSNDSFIGEFQGILPQGRTFEFRVFDEEAIIKGRLDQEIEDPDLLNREWLHKPLKVTFHVVQVGQGRPRYTLMSLDQLAELRDESQR